MSLLHTPQLFVYNDFHHRQLGIPAGLEIEFNIRSDNDTVLIMKKPAKRKDTNFVGAFERFMLSNHKQWLNFANEVFGGDIHYEDLLLVTGCDLTTDWANMVTSRHSVNTTVKFCAGVQVVSDLQLSVWGRWDCTTSTDFNCGPLLAANPARSESESYANYWQGNRVHNTYDLHEGGTETGVEEGRFDQCVFIRSKRVVKNFLGKLKAAALGASVIW